MRHFEVILKVISRGKVVKRTIIFVSAVSAFQAALFAEGQIEDQLSNEHYAKVEKVNAIDEAAFKFILAA